MAQKNCFCFKDNILPEEITPLASRYDSAGVFDTEGNINPSIVRRDVYLNDTYIESFIFDSIKDPKDKQLKIFHSKYR
jgi:hypothetical protein